MKPDCAHRYCRTVLVVMRWFAILASVVGVCYVFCMGFVLASLQGFTKAVPKLLFAVLSLPHFAVVLLCEAPWFSLPVVWHLLFEGVWQLATPKDTKQKVREAVQLRAPWVLAGLLVSVLAYCGAYAFAHRSGAAHISVFNRSQTTFQNAVLRGDGILQPLGDLLPFKRVLLAIRPPRKGETPVTLTGEVDGDPVELTFTQGLDDSRRYYKEFSISEDIQGHSSAWRLKDRPMPNAFEVHNAWTGALEGVAVSGLGYRHSIGAIGPGQTVKFRVRPKGPAIVAIEYHANGSRHAGELWRGWGREGYSFRIEVSEPGVHRIGF